MSVKNDFNKDFDDICNKHGYTLERFLKEFGTKNLSFFELEPEQFQQYINIFDKINNCTLKQEKGKLLEELTLILFKNNLFEIRKNCRTSTNEIDLLLYWTENARACGLQNIFSCFTESFLCECKNYINKVNVTYVGKFYSLMMVTNNKFGVMITWEGVTGRGKWDSSLGLIKKIALKSDMYIIVIDKHDLKRIYNKSSNIFSIIQDKYISLKNDVDLHNYIIKHDCEDKF